MPNSRLFPCPCERSTATHLGCRRLIGSATAQTSALRAELAAPTLNFRPLFWQKRLFVIFFPRGLYLGRTSVSTLDAADLLVWQGRIGGHSLDSRNCFFNALDVIREPHD